MRRNLYGCYDDCAGLYAYCHGYYEHEKVTKKSGGYGNIVSFLLYRPKIIALSVHRDINSSYYGKT